MLANCTTTENAINAGGESCHLSEQKSLYQRKHALVEAISLATTGATAPAGSLIPLQLGVCYHISPQLTTLRMGQFTYTTI